MRKVSLLLMLMVGFVFTNAQTEGSNWLKVGIHAGVPTADASDASDFALGVDAKYQFLNYDSFGIGVATGYTNYFGKDIEEGFEDENVYGDFGDTGVIPVAALLRYYPADNFFIGTDIGYGFITGDLADAVDVSGGFYYRPEVGYHSKSWNIFAYYAGVSSDIDMSNAGIGVNYNIIQPQ